MRWQQERGGRTALDLRGQWNSQEGQRRGWKVLIGGEEGAAQRRENEQGIIREGEKGGKEEAGEGEEGWERQKNASVK